MRIKYSFPEVGLTDNGQSEDGVRIPGYYSLIAYSLNSLEYLWFLFERKSMLLPLLGLLAGLALLVWSADKFIEGSATTARYFGMPQLLIGMIIIGFGTSAPEMIVSLFAAINGNAGIALGNAYGSNIVNIALILGVSALISPILVQSAVVRKEIPLLILVTVISLLLILDHELSRLDALCLLAVFALLMIWTIYQEFSQKNDALSKEVESSISEKQMSIKKALFWMITGLVILIGSSRLLVWGAVEIATQFGVSDMIIGLTIVAIGTSLPELASSVIAARKGEHDIALGNVIGSNLFNTLVVVGIAGTVSPLAIEQTTLIRDFPVMFGLTLYLLLACWGFKKKPGKINRWEALFLIGTYIAYTFYLVFA